MIPTFWTTVLHRNQTIHRSNNNNNKFYSLFIIHYHCHCSVNILFWLIQERESLLNLVVYMLWHWVDPMSWPNDVLDRTVTSNVDPDASTTVETTSYATTPKSTQDEPGKTRITLEGGVNLLFGIRFEPNCMRMKKNGLGRGWLSSATAVQYHRSIHSTYILFQKFMSSEIEWDSR